MKKISVVEIVVLIFALCAFSIYLIPKLMSHSENSKESKIKASSAIFTSKVIEEFARNENVKPSEIAKKTVEELNQTEKNPYNKSSDLYIINNNCKGCLKVEYDDNLIMIIVTGLDNNEELISRTVIKPPSFVTYYKEDNKKSN